eukprot:365573-Chlamydomonas_euryale.AAC.13
MLALVAAAAALACSQHQRQRVQQKRGASIGVGRGGSYGGGAPFDQPLLPRQCNTAQATARLLRLQVSSRGFPATPPPAAGGADQSSRIVAAPSPRAHQGVRSLALAIEWSVAAVAPVVGAVNAPGAAAPAACWAARHVCYGRTCGRLGRARRRRALAQSSFARPCLEESSLQMDRGEVLKQQACT